MKKKIFVSFDYEDDRRYRYLLAAWNQHPNIDISFHDHTPLEINSFRINRVKAALTLKIKQADKVLVVAGKNVNKQHLSHRTIKYRNWINFEVAQAIIYKKEIIVVKLNTLSQIPAIIRTAHKQGRIFKASKIEGFDREAIGRALIR